MRGQLLLEKRLPTPLGPAVCGVTTDRPSANAHRIDVDEIDPLAAPRPIYLKSAATVRVWTWRIAKATDGFENLLLHFRLDGSAETRADRGNDYVDLFTASDETTVVYLARAKDVELAVPFLAKSESRTFTFAAAFGAHAIAKDATVQMLLGVF